MYLLMELARDRGDQSTQQSIVSDMETRFPSSPWLAEALYSSGNMYLLLKDYPHAITYYGELATPFPNQSLCAQRTLADGVAQLSPRPVCRSRAAVR